MAMGMAHEVCKVEGKGFGVVATRQIARGSVIFTDKPLLTITKNGPSARDVEEAFKRLSKQDQEVYLSLSKGHLDHIQESSIVSIFRSNVFSSADSHSVYPLISRVNHSCRPNAAKEQGRMYAQTDIDIGEEICICYHDWEYWEVLTTSQRGFKLMHVYGFRCLCQVCGSPEIRSLSDLRRLLISAIRFALEGVQPTDFRHLFPIRDDHPIARLAHWPPKAPSVRPIRSNTQKIEYTFLLAQLRAAEGVISGREIAYTFFQAARDIRVLHLEYDQRRLVPGYRVEFIKAKKCAIDWMQTAVEHVEYDEDVTRYREVLRDLQTDHTLEIVSNLGLASGSSSC